MHGNPHAVLPPAARRPRAGRRQRALGVAVALVAALATAFAAFATAAPSAVATVKLACAGVGGRNMDSAGTVLCAAPAGRSRVIAGRVRSDAGKPVAAKVTVTRSAWIINKAAGGYSIKAGTPKTITAKADGTFAITSNPETRESIKVEVAPQPELGIAAGGVAQAEVQRQLSYVIAKLGGGVVRVTVKGTSPKGLKAQITNGDGYAVPGQGAKALDSHGTATFRLGANATGKFAVYLVRSARTDLFWASSQQPKFSMSAGR